MSLRTSPQTGVGIRSPSLPLRGEEWLEEPDEVAPNFCPENHPEMHWCGSTQRLPCVKGAGKNL